MYLLGSVKLNRQLTKRRILGRALNGSVFFLALMQMSVVFMGDQLLLFAYILFRFSCCVRYLCISFPEKKGTERVDGNLDLPADNLNNIYNLNVCHSTFHNYIQFANR